MKDIEGRDKRERERERREEVVVMVAIKRRLSYALSCEV